MRLPLSCELDDVFRNDRWVWLKMGGGALATVFIALRSFRMQEAHALTDNTRIAILAVAAALGAILGLALSLKDAVQRRKTAGKPVNPLLQLYFGAGVWSLLIWILTVVGVVILYVAWLAIQ